MEKIEKFVDGTLRGIGLVCFLFAVASPIIALVLWRGDILAEGLISLFLYVALVSTANELKGQLAPTDNDETEIKTMEE